MASVARTDIAQMEEAIYDESFRAISEQSRVLDGLRNRATAVAAVANVATAFLGGLALADGSALAELEWIAIGGFAAALALSLAILMPWTAWQYWHDPIELLSVYVDPGPPTTLSEFRRNVAYDNGRLHDQNNRRLRRLIRLFWVASMFVAVEVLLWLWVLAT